LRHDVRFEVKTGSPTLACTESALASKPDIGNERRQSASGQQETPAQQTAAYSISSSARESPNALSARSPSEKIVCPPPNRTGTASRVSSASSCLVHALPQNADGKKVGVRNMTSRHRRYGIVSDYHAHQTRSSNLNQRHLITLLPCDRIDLDQPAGWQGQHASSQSKTSNS